MMDCDSTGPARLDIRLVRGDTVMSITDITVGEDEDTPYDLTGTSAEMEISWGVGDAQEISLTTANGGLVITPLEGRITPVLTEPQSLALPLGKSSRYQLRITWGDGSIETMLVGFFVVAAEVID